MCIVHFITQNFWFNKVTATVKRKTEFDNPTLTRPPLLLRAQ